MRTFLLLSVWFVLAGATSAAARDLSFDPIAGVTTDTDAFRKMKLSAQLTKLVPGARDAVEKKFRETYYQVWTSSQVVAPPDLLQREILSLKDNYAENYLPRTSEFVGGVAANANYAVLGKEAKPAVILRSTDVRVLPSLLPFFGKVGSSGEGFPFDYLQFTRLYVGAPVRLSHFSKDRGWAFVETNVGNHGWVRATDVAAISDEDVNRLAKLPVAVMLKDDEPLVGPYGFIDYSAVGAMAPAESDSAVLLPIKNGPKVEWVSVAIGKDRLTREALNLESAEDIELVFRRLIGRPYSWGSQFGNRDCSSFTKDFFALFHILLQPASDKQVPAGQAFDVKGKTVEEKIAALKTHGRPFRTLLYKKGHIGIFAGFNDGKPLFLHAVWGIRTQNAGQEGRNIIGRTVLSPLDLGRKHPRFDVKSGTILDKIETIVVLGGA